ncbi:MAG: hypothetical protein RL660_1782 [Bacteroidota bacterium]
MTDHDIKWIEVKAFLQDRFGKVPDMESVLFLIGMNEVGFDINREFKKEEKQDLMHVAMCILLSEDGYYEYIEHDADGWPHFAKRKDFPAVGLKEQEVYLQEKIIKYLGF